MNETTPKIVSLLDVVEKFVTATFHLLDNSETSGPADDPVITVWKPDFDAVSSLLDQCEALPSGSTEHMTAGALLAANLYIAQAAELTRLRAKVEAGRDQIEARVEAVVRRNFVSPEDTAVEALCLRYGYGAVMDAASRLWARRDLLGAFYIGGCIGFRTEEEARAALSAYEGDKE